VIDSAGQKLAYLYFEDEPGRRSAAKLLNQRRGAADRVEHASRLPELLTATISTS
jgi:hypothetical protein